MKSLTLGTVVLSASTLAALALATDAHAIDIERPQVQFVDKLGVNLANGQVTNGLSTVTIGGAMGLSHSVSVYANEFNYPNATGFGEKFYKRAENVQLCISPTVCDPMNVMRVQDWSDSQSFAYMGPTGYTPINDERHSLEVLGNEFLWTKPDGTVVHFLRPGTGLATNVGGLLTKVEYPNGFTILVTQHSVNTNTGFQLKYFFDGSNPALDKTAPPNLQAPPVDAGWPLHNPKSIRAVNAWKVTCPWNSNPCVENVDGWPVARFEWPAGMPRTMFIGDSLVKVTNSANQVTTYKYRAYDLAYDELGAVVPPDSPGVKFSPRLVEVIPPGATATKITYDYNNLFAPNMAGLDFRLQSSGVVKTASRLGTSGSYTINQIYMGSERQNHGNPAGGVYLVHPQPQYGNPNAPYHVQTLDGHLWYETTARNFLIRFERSEATIERYYYETRSNLTKVTYNEGAAGAYQVLAEYPATCTNRKTCNQATRTRDANGNWTDFEYHALSGQVSKITSPPNKSGIRPETRFTYAEFRAWYHDASGVLIHATAPPVWLKTEERYCINSTATACSGDEVVTTYEYNHPNLLMTGTVVSAPGSLTRRTCYSYDKFGNQIGVTTPNANLSSCPGVSGETP